MKNVEVGQIYEVITDTFLVNWDGWGKDKHPRKILLEKGEKIEIRYPYEWHFRTLDNMYLQADEKTLLENCKLFGVIIERVRFDNLAQLKQILDLRLYDKIKI